MEGRAPLAPLRVLMACGWLDAADAPAATVSPRSSAHAVSLVTARDGRAAIVKQWPASLRAGRDLRQEFFVYRLARSVPALAAVLPHAWHLDEGHQVLALDAVGGGHAALPHLAGPGVAEALGQSMAAWHAATIDTGLWPSPAMGILEMPDALDIASAGRAPATQRLMRAIADDAVLAATLRGARVGWRDRCLIHGDLRRENWFAVADGESPRVSVIDWELSGSGDPLWDVAAVIVEAALDGMRGIAVMTDSSQTAPLPRFVRAYVGAGGLLHVTDADAWPHLWACAVARLLHVATEWAERQENDDLSGVDPLVAQATAWARDRHLLAEESRRWAVA